MNEHITTRFVVLEIREWNVGSRILRRANMLARTCRWWCYNSPTLPTAMDAWYATREAYTQPAHIDFPMTYSYVAVCLSVTSWACFYPSTRRRHWWSRFPCICSREVCMKKSTIRKHLKLEGEPYSSARSMKSNLEDVNLSKSYVLGDVPLYSSCRPEQPEK